MQSTLTRRNVSGQRRLALAALAVVFALGLLWLHNRKPPTVAYRITDLGILPGTDTTSGSTINASGEVSGEVSCVKPIDQAYFHIFLWRNGKMTDLGTLPGLPESTSCGLNNHGQIVGYSEKSGEMPIKGGFASYTTQSAFTFQHGKMTRLPTLPGYPDSAAYALNDSGQIVGADFRKNSQEGHGFLYSHGVLTDLGLLPMFSSQSASSAAASINPQGDVVGTGTDSTGSDDTAYHAFLYRNGKMIDLGALPDYPNSSAEAINSQGQITGFVAQSGSFWEGTKRAFLWQNGVMEELGTLPGYRDSFAAAINSRGQIVGGVDSLPAPFPLLKFLHDHLPFGGSHADVPPDSLGDIPAHAFLYQNGCMTDLNDLIPANSRWVLATANGINDKGQIVGTGWHTGKMRAFVLTPIGMK